MTGFPLHPECYTDIQEIAEYISADSLNAATRVVKPLWIVAVILSHSNLRVIAAILRRGE